MFGTFPARFHEVVRPLVENKVVVDLGAGDCQRAGMLARMKAKRVIAVDLKFTAMDMTAELSDAPRVEILAGRFGKVAPRIAAMKPGVAHLAWPSCNLHNAAGSTSTLTRILSRIPTVSYIGRNTNGSACGTRGLFDYFRMREVLAYSPMQSNTLIVYGQHLKAPRSTVHLEERGRLSGRFVPYSDTHGLNPAPTARCYYTKYARHVRTER